MAAAAKGIVDSVKVDEETGTTVAMNIGNGYELTYGQLKEVSVKEGDVVEDGGLIGYVSEPYEVLLRGRQQPLLQTDKRWNTGGSVPVSGRMTQKKRTCTGRSFPRILLSEKELLLQSAAAALSQAVPGIRPARKNTRQGGCFIDRCDARENMGILT